MEYYRQHIFICTNLRKNGKKCCQDADAEAVCQYTKRQIKSQKLSGKGGVRVSCSGCLGRCKQGPVLVVYPQGVWYTYRDLADIDEIIAKYVQGGEVVERLLVDKSEEN